MASAQQVPSAQQKRFMDLYRQEQIKGALRESKILTKRYPRAPFAWKALGNCLLQLEKFTEAAAALETAFHMTPEDPLVLNAFSRACFHTNQLDKALELQKKSLDLEPDNAQGLYNMASMLHQSGNHQDALQHLDHAERLGFDNSLIHGMRSFIFSLVFRFQEGMDELRKLYELKPNDPTVHNSLGNYYKDMADFPKAEAHYQKAKALAPKYATAYSNEILSLHYNPASTVENILDAAKEWHQQFACQTPYVHTSNSSASNDKLRIGIVSGSLRMHPVGWMITSALSHLPEDIELYIYSDCEPRDFIAQRIQQTATQWRPIYQMNQQQVAESIYSDQIHILIDLAGHGTDSRLPAIVMKPAPLIIKWVGMQISSMGIPEFDYFLSDSIETPPGVDDQYTEKLIRLPNDYVCYYPPYYKPAIAALPAISNGYITLGCFNNPAKVNDVVLREWAKLMHELPNSRLLLKGGQYSSQEVCGRIRSVMANAGIDDERLILEGPSKHQELLESYHRVDIALDPWPYSGGLTTCEAMLMGVPVVTLPGPTFAGRHSATHLTNAGMQELVVSSWEEYRQRVIELASDLPSLAVIRAALRTYLEQSPICDAERFVRHLHKALRAIWQRHCEGKPPAALTFNKGGQAWFEDDSRPVKLPNGLQRGFDWNLESSITILDNGAGIAMRSDAKELLGSGNIAVLVFDPINALSNAKELAQYGEIQHFPQVTLGSGHPIMLTSAEGEDDITSLKPLTSDIVDSLQTLEIPSIALDSIEGLESLDVLALDDRHDNLAILEHGAKALEKALLLQIRVRFNPTHKGQADLSSLTRWATKHGFRFYRLHNAEYRSHLPDDTPAELKQASELVCADALFLPSEARVGVMRNAQRTKLAFLLSTLFGVKDIAYSLLTEKKKNLYLYLESKPNYQNKREPHANQLKATKHTLHEKASSNIDIVDIKSVAGYSYSNPSGTVVIMPCIDIDLGCKTADILTRRAGTDIKIVIAYDSLRHGFIKTLNTIAQKCETRYIVYLAQDAFPGREWLKLAYQRLEQSGKGLLAFNDGKWQGKIASFGMVRKSWAYSIYNKEILYSGYNSHCADDEITHIANLSGNLVYDPNIVLFEVDYDKGMFGGGNHHDRFLLNSRMSSGLLNQLGEMKYFQNCNSKDLKIKKGYESDVEISNGYAIKKFNEKSYFFDKKYCRTRESEFLKAHNSQYFVEILESDEKFIKMRDCGTAIGVYDRDAPGGRRLDAWGYDLLALVKWLDLLKDELNRLSIKHRDINPLNIVYGDYGFKLIDFSWAIKNTDGKDEPDTPETLNPYAKSDLEAISKLQKESINLLVEDIGSEGYSDGSSTTRGWTYHPIPFEEFSSTTSHKQAAINECKEIIALEKLDSSPDKTILEIGSSVGYFSFSFAKLGHLVKAFERDSKAFKVAEALRIHKGFNNITFSNSSVSEGFLEKEERFDFAIMLNVHMWIHKQLGDRKTLNVMKEICSSVKKLYFQTADMRSGGMYKVPSLKSQEDIEKYLFECGFTKVKHLRDTTSHGGIRSLFVAEN